MSTSHSSLAHAVSDHHSPLVRHGPESARIRRRAPSQITAAGFFSRSSTPAGSGGRYMRNAAVVRRCARSEEHTSELQSHSDLVCRLLLEKKNNEERPPRCARSEEHTSELQPHSELV